MNYTNRIYKRWQAKMFPHSLTGIHSRLVAFSHKYMKDSGLILSFGTRKIKKSTNNDTPNWWITQTEFTSDGEQKYSQTF